MKKFFSLICAVLVVISTSAAPLKLKSQFKQVSKAKNERVQKVLPIRENAKTVQFRHASELNAAKKVFRAPKARKADVSFTITVENITTSGAKVTVTPSDENAVYYFDCFAAADAASMSDAQIHAALYESWEATAEDYEMDVVELLTYILSEGEDDYTFSTLKGGTEYTVVAFLVDEAGNLDGAVTRFNFTTEPIPAPTGEVVNLGELEFDYFDDYRDLDGSFVVYFVNDTAEIALCIFSEEVNGTFTFEDLDPEYSYYSSENIGTLDLQAANITAVLSEDGNTSAFTVSIIAYNGVEYTFTGVADLTSGEGGGGSGEYVDPTGGTFTIAVADITSSGAAITVTPSIVGAAYYWTVAPAADIAGLSDAQIVTNVILAEIQEIIDIYAEMGLDLTLEDFLLDKENSFTYSSLLANTEYVVVAAYLDVEGNLHESVVKKAFKTLEQQFVDLTFSFENTGSSIIVTPSNNSDKWDYIFMTPAQLQQNFGGDIDAVATAAYAYYGDAYADTGVHEFTFAKMLENEFEPGEHIIIVYGCDGGVTTPAASFAFTLTDDGQAVDMVNAEESATKFIRNGHLVIRKNNIEYNAQGAVVK